MSADSSKPGLNSASAAARLETDSRDTSPGLSYRDAGVDIERGNRLVQTIKTLAASTHRPGVLAGVGGFGALFEVPVDRYRRPVLVSGADGVGTKLKLAIMTGRHRAVGIDLVAMSVNDVLTLGAEPLYFLDYLATARLDTDVAAEVITGIALACRESGAALIGGETAEMPGMYASDDYDLAGFCVGVVERDSIIDGTRVQTGDALIALASSGPHANGYALIRKVLALTQVDLQATLLDNAPLIDHVMAPTRLYAKSVLALCKSVDVRALAHVTGGGITENLPRVLPKGLGARIDMQSWRIPAVFDWLAARGTIAADEMRRTFNLGVGMIACIPQDDVERSLQILRAAGERAWTIGQVEPVPVNNADGTAPPTARVRYQP